MASRYKQWTKALHGISNIIKSNGMKVNANNYSAEQKIINDYCRRYQVLGTFSERVLLITENFKPFRDFVSEQARKQEQISYILKPKENEN